MNVSFICRCITVATIAILLHGCGSPERPFSTTFGILHPGSTIVVRALNAEINAYKPEAGKPSTNFTIEATGAGNPSAVPVPPRARNVGKILTVSAGKDVAMLLVRVPQGVNLNASSSRGDVNVTDTTGTVIAHSDHGNVKVMISGTAQASSGPGKGNVTVYMGTRTWPGVLHFAAQQGDVEVWINADANFHAHVHTANGTIFTDFGLRGTSQGSSETIDALVGPPSSHGIDIEVADGSIRLLQLKPQM